MEHARSTTPQTQTGKQHQRASTSTEQDLSWASRPPPEDVYERLEDFFPEHDLDKPLIKANSGGTSPTAVEYPIPPASVPLAFDKSRVKGKKSIRHVAEEYKKHIDRTSKDESSFAVSFTRKRSTKLWGSRLEEVTVKEEQAILSPSPPPESLSGGPTIFKWVRGELIGRGTYGRVYLALNATTGEMIAVKQVEIPRSASDKNDSRHITVVQALKLESETLKDLDHPNIVQYLGFEETPENLSIFLEYVPGGSIGSCLLKHGKFDEEITKSFTAQILSGLEYLHSRGIIHRDLRCENILVQQDGVCKISDFGISKRTDDDGAATAMQGTVFWMAPEVVNPQGKVYNSKIDIWSVGCIVLEMWTGMRPWMGDELVTVMFKLYRMKQPPPVPDDVVLSELGDDFRKKCFAINPDERPSATELRKHKYLEFTPGWRFSGFTATQNRRNSSYASSSRHTSEDWVQQAGGLTNDSPSSTTPKPFFPDEDVPMVLNFLLTH
ncbi:kinase-like domain-containing protein [Mycena floridula]|nr:kinase-like domain-containing protein [Mycena floridula]